MTHDATRKVLALLEAMNGQPFTDGTMEMYAAGFTTQVDDELGINVVMQAIRTCKFRPSVAELWEIVQRMDGRPEPDEAWAMCPKGEAETVVWTDEMIVANRAAWPLLEDGDRIAARKAFLDVYRREVAVARSMNRPVRWSVSMGHDVGGRVSAIMAAVDAGRLSVERALTLLPPSEEVCDRTQALLTTMTGAKGLQGGGE